MNSTFDLLKLALKEKDTVTFRNYLQVCMDSKLFQKESNPENIISLVNSLINVGTSFENGLYVLKVFLPQCKSDVLGLNLMHWFQVCLKGIQNHSHSIIVYSVLRELIIFSKDYPDVRKQTSLTVIPKIMEHFFKFTRKVSNQTLEPFLRCLEEVLRNYGKACGNWKSRIEQFLLLQLESSEAVVRASASCFLNLSAVGPARANMENYKEEWLNKQKFLISALHTQLNSLFNPISEIQGNYDAYVVEYDRKCVPEILEASPLKRAQRLTAQFMSLAEFLKEMLLGSFPVCKRIHAAAVLSVVCRGLAVNCTTLEANVSNDSLILSTQIPAIQIACISIMGSLIQCCRRNLLSQGKLICKLLTQTLKWSKVDSEYGQNKPYSFLRISAYNCFNVWLTMSRKCSSVEDHINDILPSLLADIHSEKPSITLSVSTKRLKGKLGKKERKKKIDLSSTDNKVPILVNPEANRDICEAALNLIPSLIEASSSVISPKVHKQLQECVINELVMIQGAERVFLDLPIPYSDELCRLALYKCLLALCNNYHPQFPAPCNYALPIFTQGLRDDSLLISRFCGQAAANIERILQPIVPSLNFPLVLSSEISSLDGSTSKAREVNSLIIRCDDNKESKNDSLILESISSLFEKQLSEPPNGKTINNNEIDKSEEKSTSINEKTEVTPQEEPVNLVLFKNSNEPGKELDGENEVVLDVRDSSERNHETNEVSQHSLATEKSKSQKRSVDDVTNDHPQGKKKKEDTKVSHRQNGNEINELEAEMLSSFVDIVT